MTGRGRYSFAENLFVQCTTTSLLICSKLYTCLQALLRLVGCAELGHCQPGEYVRSMKVSRVNMSQQVVKTLHTTEGGVCEKTSEIL